MKSSPSWRRTQILMMGTSLWVRSFETIRIRISVIGEHSDHGRSKEPMNSLSRVDSAVHLIYHDPSDLGSLILIRIIPKERTLCLLECKRVTCVACVRYTLLLETKTKLNGLNKPLILISCDFSLSLDSYPF